MRRTALRLLLPISLLGIAGCGDPNAGRLFADFPYATRCEETLGCGGPQMHDICGFHLSDICEGTANTEEATLSCTATQTDTTRTVSFSASQGDSFSIRVSGALVPIAGGPVSGGSCQVTVDEGANTYQGVCGGSLPSDAQPCQVAIGEFYDDAGNPTLRGTIWCQHLANRATPTLKIELTDVGNGPTAEATPATFRLANCDGLRL